MSSSLQRKRSIYSGVGWGRVGGGGDNNNNNNNSNSNNNILFFEILQDLGLADSVPTCYSSLKPKRVYEANNAQALWDVSVF